MSLEPGTHFGRYEILRMLGKGGMGEVYRAHDQRLGRDVALKVVVAELAADPESLHRFEREARALAALAHPNVVPIFDVGVEGNMHYVVTELVEGETLRQRLARGGLLPPEAAEIGAQVAEGLAAAHAKGLVHRDIKPENIVLADGRARILDFGVSRRVEPAQAKEPGGGRTVSMTEAQTLIGTPSYMSPEQVRAQPVDARSDLFALGAVLFEMLTGRQAFPGNSTLAAVDAVLHAQPDLTAKEIPPSFSPILERCLARDRDERFSSAVELAQELRAAVGWDATQRTASPRVRRWARRRWIGGALLAVTVAVVVGSLAVQRVRRHRPLTSLAVLPFRAFGTEPAAHFGLGIADAVIGRLATYRQITVRPTSAVRRYEMVDTDAIQAGHHLGVDAVVEGTVRQVEGGTRAVVQLTDVGREAVVWSEQLDLPKGRLFELQDTLATRLVDHLQVKLETVARPAPGRSTGISDSALKRYLSARSQLSEAAEDPGRATALLAELNDVLQDEPGFAPALAARAYARAWRNYYAPELRGPETVLRDASEALEVDPALELPHVARASLAWSSQGGWRFVDAVRELRMAMSASPGSEIPHLELARMFYHWGWLGEARRELGEIRRIDPLSLHAVRAAAFIAWFDGHHQEALARFSESGGEGDHRSIDRRWQEAAIRLQTDPGGGPLGELEAWVAEQPGPIPMATLAVARARRGDRGISELEERILSTNQEVGHFHHVLHLLAEARAQLGDTFGAIGYLRRASETGLPCLPCFDNDPLLRGVRGAPEYAALRVELRSRSEAARAALGAP